MAFCSLLVLQECFAQHAQEDFPAPRRSAWEPFRESNSSERLSSKLEIIFCFFLHPPRVLFSSSCAFRFLFPPSRHFPFFFPLEFFFISPPVAFWVVKGSAPPRAPWDGRSLGTRSSVPSLGVSAVPGSGSSREHLSRGPRCPVKRSARLHPPAFRRGERTHRRCLPVRRVLVPQRVWHEASHPPKPPPKPPKREKLP